MSLSAREKAKRDDFDAIYRQGQLPVMRAVEQRVCGCAYGATSWATRAEADRIAATLALRPGVALLEVGAGTGWPAIYLGEQSSCHVTLTDLPVGGLKMALERAARDGLATRCGAVAADSARLPIADASFDVINQSDVLCCLVRKEEVLSECRRVIRPGGRMTCSVIYVPAGLRPDDHARAVATAPEFVETTSAYPDLLAATGWAIRDQYDLTDAFTRGCREKVRAEAELRAELEPIVGAGPLDCRHARMRRRIAVLARGHLKRALFVLQAKA